MQNRIAILLSIHGGYVDTMSFLALQGLFAAHVTGNFVTLGAALAMGTSGVTAKLLALPVFCVVVIASRWLGHGLRAIGIAPLRLMLGLMLALLCLAAGLAFVFGPFVSGDALPALVTGLVLVAAMAIQNGAQRIHLPQIPPSTLMTGSTTQAMLDLADLMAGVPGDQVAAIKTRLLHLATSILAFAAGCGMAAALFHLFGMLSFLLPPVLVLLVMLHPLRSVY